MELISHQQREEFRKGEMETPHVRPPPRILLAGIHLGWTRRAPPRRTLSQNDWLKTTITKKPEAVSHAAEQFSWVPLHSCSLPGSPFLIKSLALSAHVSPPTIHFPVLDKRPVLGPGRGAPSCNKDTEHLPLSHKGGVDPGLSLGAETTLCSWRWIIYFCGWPVV